MTSTGDAPQTCAVCKFQRRRCNSQCFLAPYFPATEYEEFQNAHKLFGVSNIIKILNVVPPDQRDAAARSIKYESHVRSRHPVHGCRQVVNDLIHRLKQAQNELFQVRSQLFAVKQCLGGQRSQTPDFAVENLVPRHLIDDNRLGFNGNEFQMSGIGNNGNPGFIEPLATVQTQPFSSRNNLSINNGGMGRELGFRGQQETSVRHDYRGAPYQAIRSDGQSYHEPREASESSGETSSMETSVEENDQINAEHFRFD